MTKIVIIDDHQLFLHGLKLTLENSNNEVLIFDNPLLALMKIEKLQPDLILMDLKMPEMDGICMIDELAKRHIFSPVVVLSACEEYKEVLIALQKGAMGFIPKSYAPQDMLAGLESVLLGNIFIPDEVEQQLENLVVEERKNREMYHLSDRQAEILSLLYSGNTNREIAEQLSISPDTVKFHQKGIYQVLQVSGVSSRAKAIEKALKVGLLSS
ncbi:transcriptional regulatory protein YdfI [Psychromonas marina]|uniref:Transcriptional regulatory protein YdfI n=1 Tax=Psychromonas marina TaxID=88364 RepID=A0ABQ6E155_9GAMM|nr:response regulator transcription factor [Psychromonas marina]GLS90935.1 transcriptional regulatory protein YdfI [Psychromonas marina]